MAIISLRAWYLDEYEPIEKLEKRSPDLRLSRNSLLKSALRADFLNESDEVRQSTWFQRYLIGEVPEFYIEGSGTYTVSNIDLISHEIYFTKQDSLSQLEPTIFFSYQTLYPESSEMLREVLQKTVETLNGRSRIPLNIEESHRLSDGPARLSSTLMRRLRYSLLYIADATSVMSLNTTPAQVVPSPQVCVEVGYALQCKRPEQILVAEMERPDMPGLFPFDIPGRNRLQFRTAAQLRKALPEALESQLERFSLFS